MFYKGELFHIAISVVTISLAFSIPFFRNFWVVLATVGAGFVLHEMAHKVVAMRFGCMAVYKAWMEGLVLAIILAVATQGQIVFAAPGAVYIYKQYLSRREDGLISIAGPATNIFLAFAFISLASSPTMHLVGIVGFQVNAFLAFFNLVPIPPLDGSKVMFWNPLLWAAAFFFSGMLVFAPHLIFGTFFA